MRCKKEDTEEKRHKTMTVKLVYKQRREHVYMKEGGKDKEFDIRVDMSHPLNEDLENVYRGDQGSNCYFSSKRNS
jgi:hypothetical protein